MLAEKKPATQAKRILLVDDEEIICKSLKKLLEKEGFEVETAMNGETARNLISLEDYDVVLSDIHMPGKISGIELFHFAKKTKNLPVILMTGFATLAETKEANDLGVDGFLAKPFKVSDLQAILNVILPDLKKAAAEPAAVNLDENYCKLSINDFISGKQIQFSIFIRLNESKYVKVADGGQDLSMERIHAYKEKGIQYLHLLKEDFHKYMKFSIGLVNLVKDKKTFPNEKKLHLMRHTTEVLLENVYTKEMDAEAFEDTKAIVEASVDFLTEHQQTYDLLAALNGHSDTLYAHSVAVSTYSTLIAKNIGWHTPATLYKIAMGGLLHDFGKKEIPREILNKPRNSLEIDEIQLLETHPSRGAEALSRVQAVPSDVLQIVLQHHERDLGTGYPSGLKKGKIHPLARLVGVADEFCYWVIKGPDSQGIPPADAIDRITMLYGSVLDPSFVSALKKIFKIPE